jgi:ribonuclease Y
MSLPVPLPVLAQVGEVLTAAAIAVAMGTIVGILGSYLVMRYWDRARLRSAKEQAQNIMALAEADADVLRQKAEVEAQKRILDGQETLRREGDAKRVEIREIEKRLDKRNDSIDAKQEALDTKERQLEALRHQIEQRQQELNGLHSQAEQLVADRRRELLKAAGVSAAQAQDTVLRMIRDELEHEEAELVERSMSAVKEEVAHRSREIILTAIQRYAAEHTAENTVSSVDIPSDDMKGRVIGREGRNIRAFERATGVDVIVDDTPGVVLVSAFDPVRREIARQSLERLIQDGRIHPGRIEELVQLVTKEVEEDIFEAGKRASVEAGVGGLHRKQLDLLGRLKYRTSYGQNVLRHSLECAFLCQAIADELGLDGRLARRCGLLHDIGKAIDHTQEGGHPKIGADFCKRFNERPEVLNAIEGHHGDIPSTSPYTPIVMAADAISASRPGSRRESLERYIQRLQQLEEIAKVYDGVDEAYAIQAGREVRVIVDARRVDDAASAKIARDIAAEIEDKLTYPGEIKVTVLRELRVVAQAR